MEEGKKVENLLAGRQSRREFFKTAGKVVGGALAAWKLKDIVSDPQGELSKPTIALANYLDSGDQHYIPQKVEIEAIEDPNKKVLEYLFASTPEPDRQTLLAKINEQRDGAGRATAAEFTAILSAPAARIRRASATERMPPPTVNGINMFCEAFSTIFKRLLRPYKLATTSI